MDEGMIGTLVVKALTEGGLGTAAWAIWNAALKKWPRLVNWTTLATRAAVYVICAVLVAPVFALAVVMLWLPQPIDWRGWVNSVGGYALVAWLWSQTAHALQKDKQERKERPAA